MHIIAASDTVVVGRCSSFCDSPRCWGVSCNTEKLFELLCNGYANGSLLVSHKQEFNACVPLTSHSSN